MSPQMLNDSLLCRTFYGVNIVTPLQVHSVNESMSQTVITYIQKTKDKGF